MHKAKLQNEKRLDQIRDGAYDGRYKSKVIPNKKKLAQKNWARNSKSTKKI
jgi:hypothetical protein